MATILTKKSDTSSAVPGSGDLTNSTGGAELAVNTADKRIFTKNSGGTVVELGTNPSTLTVTGNTTLGDASGDSVTINAATVSTPNGLNFDSNTFVIDAANNRVGVGTASPVGRFDIFTSSSGEAFIRSSSSALRLVSTGGENYIQSGTAATSSSPAPLIFCNVGGINETMRITATGLVGIGTSSPSYALHVNGTSKSIYLSDTSSGLNLRLYNGTSSAGISGLTYPNQIISASANVFELYTAGSAPIVFGTSATERLRIDSSGNVGIGTSSPATNLEISGGASTELRVVTSGSLASTGASFVRFGGSNSATSGYVGYGGNASEYRVWNALSGNMAFGTNNTERMRITSGGNVLIGSSTNNGEKLRVNASPATNPATSGNMNSGIIFQCGDGSGALNVGQDASNNTYYNAAYANNAGVGLAHRWLTGGTERMRIDSSGNVAINTTSGSGGRVVIAQSNATQPAIYLPTDESTIQGPSTDTQIRMGGNLVLQSGNVTGVSAKNASGYIYFSTGSTPSERMRIDSSGNLLVGTTTNADQRVRVEYNGASPSWAIKTHCTATSGNNNFIEFGTEATFTPRGSITYNRAGGLVAYNTISDQRLKDNIVDAPSAISKINSIQIRSFDWKETGNHVDFGVIAQELVQVAPESVTEGTSNEDGSIKTPWGVDTSVLVPAMVKAIQELKAENDALKSRLDAAGL